MQDEDGGAERREKRLRPTEDGNPAGPATRRIQLSRGGDSPDNWGFLFWRTAGTVKWDKSLGFY